MISVGAAAFVLARSLFKFVMVGLYDKDAASVRFAVLQGVVGFPVSALIALLAAYLVFAKNKGKRRGISLAGGCPELPPGFSPGK